MYVHMICIKSANTYLLLEYVFLLTQRSNGTLEHEGIGIMRVRIHETTIFLYFADYS